MAEQSRRLVQISERLSNDPEFRAALAREAEALTEALGNSILAPYALVHSDAAAVISLLAPGRALPLDRSSVLDLLTGKPPHGPDGPGDDPPPTPGGGGGGGCFEGSTLVSTADGLRPISTIRVGEIIETPTGLRAVVEIRRVDRDGLVQVDVGNGLPIRCSREHCFHMGDRGWIHAHALEAGGALTAGADLVELPSPTVALDGRFEVFDLILDGERRFYVGEARLVARKPHSDG